MAGFGEVENEIRITHVGILSTLNLNLQCTKNYMKNNQKQQNKKDESITFDLMLKSNSSSFHVIR